MTPEEAHGVKPLQEEALGTMENEAVKGRNMGSLSKEMKGPHQVSTENSKGNQHPGKWLPSRSQLPRREHCRTRTTLQVKQIFLFGVHVRHELHFSGIYWSNLKNELVKYTAKKLFMA